MRLGIISDIHGNFIALETVLVHIKTQEPDLLICLGDVATIGPQPNKVLDALRSLDCICLKGNHDDALLQPASAVALNIDSSLLSSLEWTLSRLDEEDLSFLASFSPTYSLALNPEPEILCFHGSPKESTDQILATTPADEIDAMLGEANAAVYVGGHTHVQMLRQHRGRLLINAGSVGHGFLEVAAPGAEPSLLPWAEYAVVDVQAGAVGVTLHRLPYDVGALLEAVRASDMPADVQQQRLRQYQESLRRNGTNLK